MRIHVDSIGDLAVVECAGRMASRRDALRLRAAVTSKEQCQIVVIDLTEVDRVGVRGLGMLVLLQDWAFNHDMQLKLFNPSSRVRVKLEQARAMCAFDVATLDEIVALISRLEMQALAS